MTRTMNAYGLVTNDSKTNTENAERVMAAMFATVQNGDTTMAQLSENMGKVASTAAAANIPVETVGAAIAALTGAGIKTEESMTLLNSLIKELLAPSDDLSKALGGLSVATDGLPAVMERLKIATGGSADKVYQLFSSSEAAKGALILANDSAGKFHNTLTAMSTSVEAFNRNYEMMAGGVADSTKKLENNIKILLQKVGAPLEGTWAEILDGMSAIAKGFKIGIDDKAFEPVYTELNVFGGRVADILKKIGENLPEALKKVDFKSAIESLKELGIDVGSFFDGMDFKKPEDLAKAIQFVVDSFESLTIVVSGIIENWQPVVKGLLEGVAAFNGLDDGAKKSTGNFLGFAQVFETLNGSLTSGVSAIGAVGDALQALAGIQVADRVAALATALGVSTPVAVAGAAALATVAVSAKLNYDAFTDLQERNKTVADSMDNIYVKGEKNKFTLEQISKATGVTVTTVDELDKAIADNLITFDAATGKYSAAGSGVRDFDAEVKSAIDSNFDFADAVNHVADIMGLNSDKTSDVIGSYASLEQAQNALVAALDDGLTHSITFENGLYLLHGTQKAAADSAEELGKKTEEASKAAVSGSKEWKTVQDVLLAAQKQSDEFKIALGELAAKRYEIDVKANVDLQTAQIEADTQRIQSAFQAASDVISSLSQGVVELWGLFSDKNGFSGSDELRSAAERMELRLDEELQLKRDLTKAVVDQASATTARLNSGQPLISIDAGNLAPELELVFDKILKYTQVKATQQGLSLLVGI